MLLLSACHVSAEHLKLVGRTGERSSEILAVASFHREQHRRRLCIYTLCAWAAFREVFLLLGQQIWTGREEFTRRQNV